MPRLILRVGGAQPSAVRTAALDVPDVQDAVEAAQANAVIVNVGTLTPDVRERLADLPGVTGVFDDLQAIPQVADEGDVEDFLNRVRELRGEEEVPPTLETRPLIPDGGAVTLPAPAATAPTATQTGPIGSIDASLVAAGIPQLHEAGLTGAGIISVIVDTGACASAIRSDRQLDGLDLSGEGDPWTPLSGHGGMTTGIMAGDETTPGVDVGALPDSRVFPVKTTLAASELIQVQDAIVNLADANDELVVVNNSYGFTDCTGICNHPVTAAIDNAARHPNVVQVFAAGNHATGDGGCGTACDGSTPGISGPNSLSSVLTAAASGLDGNADQLQPYSSRGAAGGIACGRRKPDVAAPVFGRMPWGCSSRDLGNGGGTSAACPQVAGAVGLLAEAGIRSPQSALLGTAEQFRPSAFNGCSGAGNIRVAEAAGAGDGDGVPPPRRAGLSPGTRGVISAGIAAGFVGAILRRAIG